MKEKIKKINIKEFRELGYLQELNRQFLHPLGLALETIVEEDGSESLGGIWDYRRDKEGVHYNLKESDLERKKEFQKKNHFIFVEGLKRHMNRYNILGFTIEPIE